MALTDVKLGKLDYVHDPKTLKLAAFVKADAIAVPPTFNFDSGKKPFPNNMWGNDAYGNCVFAARANSQVRLERLEQRKTILTTDEPVIAEYKLLTGCVSPGDANDTGYVILYAMRQWRKDGWKIGARNYTVYAYGELDPVNHLQLKQGIFALAGVHFGFGLPKAVAGASQWHYNGETGPEWEVGSWGGHCVYGFAYDAHGITVKTWGENVHVNWAFIDKYSDEAWSVVDSADSWRIKQTVDVNALSARLGQITTTVDQ
jgi:hypothetical protein